MPHIGYTYARALRAIMRQDPDVILIGKVRDLPRGDYKMKTLPDIFKDAQIR